MVKTPVFKGACTAIVTPFTEHGIDYERLGRNINYQYENGVSAIVVCGTTGETRPSAATNMRRSCATRYVRPTGA